MSWLAYAVGGIATLWAALILYVWVMAFWEESRPTAKTVYIPYPWESWGSLKDLFPPHHKAAVRAAWSCLRKLGTKNRPRRSSE